MTAVEILKKWLEYAEYDPGSHTSRPLTALGQFQDCCKVIAKFMPYDPSAELAVLYAQRRYESILENFQFSALDVISQPEDLQDHIKMWRLLHSEDMTAIQENVLNTLDTMVSKVIPAKQIGSRDLDAEKDVLLASIEAVVEELDKCNVDVFLHGGTVQEIRHFSPQIHVFERLSECLLALEHAPDGIYLCFVRCDDSVDGFFGFYIKSNGTLFSINEQIKEAFPGEHSGRRNNRWAERKQYSLFPYGCIVNFEGSDYKGYATRHIINDEKLEDNKLAFFNLNANAYMPLLIAMMLLARRYSGVSMADHPLMYVDSLLPMNLALESPSETALMDLQSSSLVAAGKSFSFPITSQGVLSAEYAADFREQPNIKGRYHEFGVFDSEENIFVKLYGEGFEYDPTKILVANQHIEAHRKALPATALAVKDPAPHPEFVGTERGMKIIAYMQAREQLAEHLREQIYQEYISFGGAEAVRSWWEQQLLASRSKVFSMCADSYRAYMENNTRYSAEQLQTNPCCFASNGNPAFVEMYLNHTKRYSFREGSRKQYPFNAYTPTGGGTFCPITGTKASHYFYFNIYSWQDMAAIVGEENIPKILMGYHRNGHHPNGNHILSVTDAVTGVGTPFEDVERYVNKRYWTVSKWRDYYTQTLHLERPWDVPVPETALSEKENPATCYFQFAVGFSKRGLAKLLKGEF